MQMLAPARREKEWKVVRCRSDQQWSSMSEAVEAESRCILSRASIISSGVELSEAS